MRMLIVLLVLVVAGIAGSQYYASLHPQTIDYTTEPATRQDVIESVSVTGYAEPVEYTVVQSEVPGIVAEVLVDYNDEVKDGQILAKLRSDTQRLQLRQAQTGKQQAGAALEGAKAKKATAEAALKAAKAELQLAKVELTPTQNLAKKSVVPQSKAEASEALVKKAEAGVTVAEGNLKQAEAAVAAAESKVAGAEDAILLANLALDKTELTSNMTGVVLDMDIHVGDAAGRPKFSLIDSSSPGLFQIAAPLDCMRAVVRVSEADYARIKVGQRATFTIDAYPNKVFEAEVSQIRNSPTSDQTAVTYDTVLEFKNQRDPQTEKWMVKPRATVEAAIEIRRAKDVLVVPNAALLFLPNTYEGTVPEVKQGEGLLWKVDAEGKLSNAKVRTGISDGVVTEVIEGEVQEGDQFIVSEPVTSESTQIRLPFGS